MGEILICDNVFAAYDNKNILNDVSFSIKNGDFLSIVGSNGSGKTSLIKLILGFLKPTHGTVQLVETNNTHVGYMPQRNQEQSDFPSSVLEVVLSGCINQMGLKPFYTRKEKDIAQKNLSRLQIENIKKSSFQYLSGGQQQKVLLARALCATQKILVLDEPTTGLDPASTSEFYSLLHSLNTESKLTIIMVTHDVKAAITYSNTILHLQNRVLFFGGTEAYIRTPQYLSLEEYHHA